MHRTPSLASCITLVLTVVAAVSAGQPASFQGLGDLPGGDFSSWGYALPADGSAVIGSSDVGQMLSQTFRWTQAEGIDCLRDLSGACVEWSAIGISGDGSVVVGHFLIGGEGVRWTVSGGIELLNPGVMSAPYDASADGSVIVGQARFGGSDSYDHTFRWTQAGGMVDLGTLGGPNSAAHSVSADGSVVVGISESSPPFNVQAFRWTEAEGMVGLGGLSEGATQSTAEAVSADGSVIVGGSESPVGFEAFSWTQEGGMAALGFLPGGFVSSRATAVSADGSVIVGRSRTDPLFAEVFIWDSIHGMRNLREVLIEQGVTDVVDWTLKHAPVISADGQTIAGSGANPNGDLEGWIATLLLHPGACPADLDGDHEVNAADLAQLLGAWGPNPGHPADFNGDDVVNAADLAQLLGTWGPC
ncbi:MAG: dockerin type I domain-containing protein [Planctomycetota bacterium]|nr:dockerin type I domain-containing protein [Planctomycetota bacterium]